MRWPVSFKASLVGKFLLSYLLIVLVGVATLLGHRSSNQAAFKEASERAIT